MSQRDSGHKRVELDAYETPEWVTEALIPHLPFITNIWEPASGSGKMVRVLRNAGYEVEASDIKDGGDFFTERPRKVDAIITNPPYQDAQKFIEHALSITNPSGIVAMLLRTDFDHAKTRTYLFNGQRGRFAKKVVLTRRIRWFEKSTGSPSFNHAWFIWNWRHKGPPTLAYGP